MKTSTLALAALFLLPTTTIAAEPTPADFGAAFCKGGIDNDMSAIEAALTPDLAKVIAEAEAKNAEIQAATPDEKPPLGDGLPWRSWPDYADGCEVGTIAEDAGKTLVEISLQLHQFARRQLRRSPRADSCRHRQRFLAARRHKTDRRNDPAQCFGRCIRAIDQKTGCGSPPHPLALSLKSLMIFT
ncbi:hypothetical protein [Devosia sp.]|uniref:hypothetical protein n=1 Tax=Devosia sp. TaxID=1871048 RepID=UPI0025EC9C5F|nr:hypothetical protein [Devosia sp.]MCR6635085.1 hypothetical protein [Devosia sp.]